MQAISETINKKNNVITLQNKKQNNVINVSGNDVKRIAHYIADKLSDYSSVEFFYKCAWHIPEQQLMLFLENALKPNVRNSRAVFTWQCNNAMKRYQGSQTAAAKV